MITLSYPWYVVQRIGQNKVHLLAQTLSDAKLVLLHQIPESDVVNRTRRSHCDGVC